MNMEKKCLRCGSENLTPANFESSSKIDSRSESARLVSVLTTGVIVNATLCLDCGHIDMAVNPSKVKALSKVSCTPILMLIWNFLGGVFTPFKTHSDEELDGPDKADHVCANKVS